MERDDSGFDLIWLLLGSVGSFSVPAFLPLFSEAVISENGELTEFAVWQSKSVIFDVLLPCLQLGDLASCSNFGFPFGQYLLFSAMAGLAISVCIDLISTILPIKSFALPFGILVAIWALFVITMVLFNFFIGERLIEPLIGYYVFIVFTLYKVAQRAIALLQIRR